MEEISDLKKAIYVLLYDLIDTYNLALDDSDEDYIDRIITALIDKNENTCPYKNYSCVHHCKCKKPICEDGTELVCSRELEDVWREFILH